MEAEGLLFLNVWQRTPVADSFDVAQRLIGAVRLRRRLSSERQLGSLRHHRSPKVDKLSAVCAVVLGIMDGMEAGELLG